MSKKIKILLVDDHSIVRHGLAKLLNTEDDLVVIGDSDNGAEGIELAEKLQPDIMIIDIAMPGMSGLETIPIVKQISPETKIIVLSMYCKEPFAQEALKAGASAYLLKGDNSEELVVAIKTVASGGHYFSERLRKILISTFVGDDANSQQLEINRYQKLSDRERQFFRLMMTGYSTQKISDLMGISYKTAQKHRTNVAKKLGTNSPVELHKYAIRIGVVDTEMLEATWK